MAAAMDTVISSDGTRIAYERTGEGPPIVLIHGSLNDHNAWAAVAPLLADRFTVYAIDRRGRGGSGPIAEHAIEREFEDVCAVIDEAGGPVDLVGHSLGAHVALGAAAVAPERIKHLVLYEPPTPAQMDAPWFEESDASEAVARFFRENVRVPQDQVEALQASPFWPYFVAHAPSYPPEMRALTSHRFDPTRFSSLKMPALLLVGSETDELGELLRNIEPYLGRPEWHTFEGQGHGAMRNVPDVFAQVVTEFLSR
jgi:pimeloyl-ACP methyl ester carboxylesterase